MAETPLMRQYREMKKEHSDMVLFFRVGDFYEMFDDDAREVSALLNLTLTHKGDDPMCGIPYHAARNYIKRLLDAGKKIAICEQMELSENSKSLARREVVRIVTPATVVDEDYLDDRSFNYIICFFQQSMAFCDVSTGDFHMRSLDPKNRVQAVRTALEQLSPREILVCEDEYFLDYDFKSVIDLYPAMVTKLAPWYFTQKTCNKLLCEQAKVKSLAAYGLKDNDKLVCPAGALIRYITETSKSSVSHLTDYKVDYEQSYVSMDESSRKNLELFNNLFDGSSRYSLFEAINRTKTSGGSRLLKNWIAFPLHDVSKIAFRQKWVSFLVSDPAELARVREAISGAMDLNRLVTRVMLRRCVPHDLVGIKQTIGSFFSLISANTDRYLTLLETSMDQDALGACAALMDRIDRAINDQCLGQFQEGQVILPGYDEELDHKRDVRDHSDIILKDYLEKVKAESGLTILKLGYNRIFGYYLEVPKGQVSKVPSYFYRKQTLVNGERFTTEELMQYEKEIMQANALAEERERKLYDEILSNVLDLDAWLNSMGHFLNNIDVYQGLATLAVDSSYVCPEVVGDDVLVIRDGRHPVVERQLGPGKFVANGLDMSVRFCLITGPNMAGKSTYLRQNALIILLAHMAHEDVVRPYSRGRKGPEKVKHRLRRVVHALQENGLARNGNAAVYEPRGGGNGLRGDFVGAVELRVDPHLPAARKSRGELRRDSRRVHARRARAEPHNVDLPKLRECVYEAHYLVVREDERVAAGDEDVPHLGVRKDVSCATCDPSGALHDCALAEYAAPRAVAAVRKALVGSHYKNPVRESLHKPLHSRATTKFAERVGGISVVTPRFRACLYLHGESPGLRRKRPSVWARLLRELLPHRHVAVEIE